MNKKQSSGFTLLEVLIALLVLSVGLLGLAGLQTRGLATGHNAYLRGQAVLLADDMAERIRANSAYALSSGNDAYTIKSDSPKTCFDDECLCVKAACSGSEMATFDVEQWSFNLANVLPQGKGGIVKTGSVYTITTQWNVNNSSDSKPDQTKPDKSYSIDIDLGS